MTTIDGAIHAQHPKQIQNPDTQASDRPDSDQRDGDAAGQRPESGAQPARGDDKAGRSPTLSQTQILDVTERCLRSVGYDKTTIRKIAGELDCAVGSIYRYFKDKRELLYAVCQRRMERTARLIASGAQLGECVLDYHHRVSEDPGSYRMMFWLAAVTADQDKPGVPPVIREIIDAWAQRLGSRDTADRLWASVHGSMMIGHDAARTLEAAQAVLSRGGQASATTATRAEPEPQATRDDVTLL